MTETIVEVLMRRDDMCREEAETQVQNFKELVEEMLEEGDVGAIEEEFQSAFGLEPDYLFDILLI